MSEEVLVVAGGNKERYEQHATTYISINNGIYNLLSTWLI